MGYDANYKLNPERVRRLASPFMVYQTFVSKPRVLAALEPWAKISQTPSALFQMQHYPRDKDGGVAAAFWFGELSSQ